MTKKLRDYLSEEINKKQGIEEGYEFEAFLAGFGDDDDIIDFFIDSMLQKQNKVATDKALRKQEKLERERQESLLRTVNTKYKGNKQGSVYYVNCVSKGDPSSSDQFIEIYPNKCVIGIKESLMQTDISRSTIYYGDCFGFTYKPAASENGIGYLQFKIPYSTPLNTQKAEYNDNTFSFTRTAISDEEMQVIVDYISSRFDVIKEKQLALNGTDANI